MFRLAAALLLLLTIGPIPRVDATLCIQNNRFKVKQLCGVVVDQDNVPIPRIKVELIDLNIDLPDVFRETLSDETGNFMFADIRPGEYALETRFSGFATARQSLVLVKRKSGASCKKPIRIQLQLAGNCSSVSVPNR